MIPVTWFKFILENFVLHQYLAAYLDGDAKVARCKLNPGDDDDFTEFMKCKYASIVSHL